MVDDILWHLSTTILAGCYIFCGAILVVTALGLLGMLP
jgi:hypothetical protein